MFLWIKRTEEAKKKKKILIHGMNEMNRHRLPSPGLNTISCAAAHTTRKNVNYVLYATHTHTQTRNK